MTMWSVKPQTVQCCGSAGNMRIEFKMVHGVPPEAGRKVMDIDDGRHTTRVTFNASGDVVSVSRLTTETKDAE